MKTILSFFIVFSSVSAAASELVAVDDSAVKDQLVRANRYRHADVCDDARRHALEMIGWDTNRFCRIVKELAAEDPASSALYVWLVGKHGGTNETEYMYAVLDSTNSTYEARGSAAEMVLRLDAPSRKMVMALGAYISNSNNADRVERNWVAKGLVNVLAAPGNQPFMVDARSHLRQLAREDYSYCISMDDMLCEAIPGYEHSVERLDYLREAQLRGVYTGKDFPLGILTNRIDQLVAYPESALTDSLD